MTVYCCWTVHMISYSYHVCIKIKFIPPLCLSLTSGGGGTATNECSFDTWQYSFSKACKVLTCLRLDLYKGSKE